MIRRTTHFSGHVQGVGFRYTVQDLARQFPLVRGYVRNLADGRVQMVAEGEEADIARLIERIGEKMEGFIRDRIDVDAPATGEFKDFAVRR
jgi:acylphosphatase